MTKLQTVKLSECRVGDVVQAHGGRWQLVELTAADDTIRTPLECATGQRGNGFRSFRTVFLGDAETGRECGVPKSWRKTYAIQSNDYATWAREIA